MNCIANVSAPRASLVVEVILLDDFPGLVPVRLWEPVTGSFDHLIAIDMGGVIWVYGLYCRNENHPGDIGQHSVKGKATGPRTERDIAQSRRRRTQKGNRGASLSLAVPNQSGYISRQGSVTGVPGSHLATNT